MPVPVVAAAAALAARVAAKAAAKAAAKKAAQKVAKKIVKKVAVPKSAVKVIKGGSKPLTLTNSQKFNAIGK